MRKTLSVAISLALALLVAVGCGPSARRTQSANSMKQLGIVRIEAISMGKPIPSLEEAGKSLGMDVTLFEATDRWADKNAPGDAVVLRERVPIGGSRLVARADGSVVTDTE